ncbi:hypothetical protein B0J12DRAFT_722435 [Macrophomina phaseolina]|uniref:Rhodopsin domain-containing protein n=1 Tax=Macrophomina phaseolina TaxID=35725 RepID=A0ABQ8FRR0_9PEZI|nr:hypothetical protein B0J12DRAFT_722435 [Macrophomina phaseolina]
MIPLLPIFSSPCRSLSCNGYRLCCIIEAYRRRIDGVAWTTYILMMLLVPLRIFCRKKSRGWSNVRLDDYMSVLALLPANGFFYACIIGMRKSLGLHIAEITDPDRIIEFLKIVYIIQIMYVWAISITKFSVLAFYWRLFSVSARITIWIVTFMAVSWFVALVFLTIFTCVPVQAAWDVTITNAKCTPLRPLYVGASIPNVILDFIIVMLPIPYVWRLHAPVAQRLLLAGIFALGTFIAVVSLVRLIIFIQIPIGTQGDLTYNFREIIVWSIVELNIGLTCACLPSLKPAFDMIGLAKLFSFTSSRPSNGKSHGPSSNLPSLGMGTVGSRATGPRKKGPTGGLFSTLAGLKKTDSEDGLKIIDNESAHGKQNDGIEMSRLSNDSSQRNAPSNSGISVQRDWSVFMDESRDIRRY